MSKTLGRAELVTTLSAATHQPRIAIDELLQALATTIKTASAEGRTVTLPGLGRFQQRTRAARVGRNPATGAPMDIPETTILTFKPTKSST